MYKITYAVIIGILLGLPLMAQETSKPTNTGTVKIAKPSIFRATKEQIIQVQKRLKLPETGKLDDETRAAIKKYQGESGIKKTGTLNRITLEKFGIELTDKQKAAGGAITPPEPDGPLKADPNAASQPEEKPEPATKRKPPFRASKEQIMQVQRMLKMAESGKLDDETRAAIKKYQEANGIKVTGTLNKDTLVKMGIELSDKQKEY